VTDILEAAQRVANAWVAEVPAAWTASVAHVSADPVRAGDASSSDHSAQGGAHVTMVSERVDRIWNAALFAWCWLAAAGRDLWRWGLERVLTLGWQQHRAPAHGPVEVAILIGVVAVATLAVAKLVIPAIMSSGDRAIQSLNGSGTGVTRAGT
jgi:hypothetical protein